MVKITKYKPPNNSHRGKDPYYQSKEWKRLREQVKKRDRGVCQGCLRETGRLHRAGKYATVDHIIPRKQGGPDTLENLELVCKKYHDRKSAQEKHATTNKTAPE